MLDTHLIVRGNTSHIQCIVRKEIAYSATVASTVHDKVLEMFESKKE